MSDDNQPRLPTADDKKKALEFAHFCGDNVLKGASYGDEQCDNCQYYLDPDSKLSYCWHPKIRLAVGAIWWCQWWEEIIDESAADDLAQLEPKAIDEKNAEAFERLKDAVKLKGVPYDDQRCDNCHFYHLDPGKPDMEAKLAYCWHEKLQIPAGADWWCERWEKISAP